MRLEEQLLLGCARTVMDSRNATQIRDLLKHPIDTTYLMNIAAWHGMMPLLYCHLSHESPSSLLIGDLKQLEAYFHANSFRNSLLVEELFTILHLLKKHGISAIPFKGPTLAIMAYHDLSLRQFGDLDIFVRKQDISKIKEVLMSNGYNPSRPLTATQEHIYLTYYHAYLFEKERGDVNIDLHWRVVQRTFSFPVDMDALWTRLKPVTIQNETLLTFSPEDMILLLCVHGSKHLWARLIWICDLAELIRSQSDICWQKILSDATRLGCRRMVLLGLSLAHHLLDVNLPEDILITVNHDPIVKTLLEKACTGLFSHFGIPHSTRETFLFHLKMRERLRDKIHRIVTPNMEELLWLPPRFLWISYFLRPFRLFISYPFGQNKIVQYFRWLKTAKKKV